MAQNPPDCDPQSIAAEFADRISTAATLNELSAIQNELRQVIADCTTPASPTDGILYGTGIDDAVLTQTYDLPAGYYLIEYHARWDGDSRFSVFSATFTSDTDDPFGWSGEVGRGDVFGRRIQRLNHGGIFTVTVDVSGVTDWQFAIAPLDEEETSPEMSLSVEGAIRDVLGPIYLAEGYYRLNYDLIHNPYAIGNISTINIVWTKPNAHERIGVDLEIGQGDWRGQNLYYVEGGIYYINFEVTGVSAWTVHLAPD